MERDPLLRKAAATGHALGARLLISLGADVNAVDGNGGTALFEAAGHAHPEVVRVLLQAGADPTLNDHSDWTPLCYSLYSGEPESVRATELLIQAGALNSLSYPFGCIGNSRTSFAHIEVLLRYGVDPHGEDRAAPILQFAEYGDVRAVRTLVDHGASVDTFAPDGHTPLTKAVRQHNFEVVEYLLQQGADTSITVNGQSLLDMAEEARERSASAPCAVIECDKVLRLLERFGRLPKAN